MTTLTRLPYTLPAAQLGEENPLPVFRAAKPDLPVGAHPSLPEEKRRHLGWRAGYRVLPYRMQDRYNRHKETHSFQALVLENEYLRATFLPEMGGRLVSLVWLPLNRELLHRNPVFQPADLAIRNAWFSGGIEWNLGQYGHTFTTCSPLFAAEIRGPKGEPGLRMYEYERCKQIFWHIDFFLPPGQPFLTAYVRAVNPRDVETSIYWWTNIAVNEGPDVRVLAPAEHAVYIDLDGPTHSFGYTTLPGLPSLKGKDGTYSTNSSFANEFFFQCDGSSMPWEAALDRRGSGLIEASTPRLKYRKLFCWGMHPGGRHWQSFLAQPGEAYIEIQGGLAPTQVHGLPMPPLAVWDWTQVFGYLEADPAQVHSTDWTVARQAVEGALHHKMTPAQLTSLEQQLRASADQAPVRFLHTGSGWGALELRRREQAGEPPLSPAFAFPAGTLGSEQKKWLALLESGSLPVQPPSDLPGEWMVQPEWAALLDAALEQSGGQHWYSLLHQGVMRMEGFDPAGAQSAWEESIRLRPSAWAYRNLGVLALRRGDAAAACSLYRSAWELALSIDPPPLALAIEYLQLLVHAGEYAPGRDLYASLPPEIQQAERVQILSGHIALALGDLESVEQVFSREYSVIREGETTLTNLWFDYCALRETGKRWKELEKAQRKELAARFPPPEKIDFRSVEEE